MPLWLFILIVILLAVVLKLIIKSTAKFIVVIILIGGLGYFGLFILPAIVGDILVTGTYWIKEKLILFFYKINFFFLLKVIIPTLSKYNM